MAADTALNKHLLKCDLCGSGAFEDYLCAPDFRLGIGKIYHLYKCRNCGLISLFPHPEPAELAAHYPDWLWEADLLRANQPQKRFKDFLGLLARFCPTPGNLLDVGCGPGDFLLATQSLGWQSHGLEINAHAVEVAHNRGASAQVISDFCNYWPNQPFDVITFHHVLEHVPSPKAYLDHAHLLLRPQGKLLVSVPNINSWSAQTFGPYWWHLDLPRHLYHFSEDTLRHLLELVSESVIYVGYNSRGHNSGGIRRSAQRWVKFRMRKVGCDRDYIMSPIFSPSTQNRSVFKKLISTSYETAGNLAAYVTEQLQVADTINCVAQHTRNIT